MASSASLWKYDVFLSFRGKDTGRGFVSHLVAELDRRFVDTFKYDGWLEMDDPKPSALQAIEASRYAILIISPNFASSSPCVAELLKLLECKLTNRLTLLTVFYEVDPSDVCSEIGCLAAVFKKNKDYFKDCVQKVQSWKGALNILRCTEAGDSNKWENDAAGIKRIVNMIKNELFPTSVTNGNVLVGMEAHLKEMERLLCLESSKEVRFVGVWGIGGVGKTTIVRYMYEKYRPFRGCFIDMTRAHNKRSLVAQFLTQVLNDEDLTLLEEDLNSHGMKKRLGQQKVFVVLDNLKSIETITTLASKDLYGEGSRIIIITEDKNLLDKCGVTHTFEVKCMAERESFQLFCLHAFEENSLEEGFEDLSREIVHITRGHPLALEVLGAFLHGRSLREWRGAVHTLRKLPSGDAIQMLKISYDSLYEDHKSIFLVAVFFLDQGWRYYDTDGKFPCVKDVVKACDYDEFGILVLDEMCLIKLRPDKEIEIPEILRQMGRDILDETGSLPTGFQGHEEKFNDSTEKVQSWEEAMRIVADIAREDSKHWEYETEKVKKIIRILSNGLSPKCVIDSDFLVGMDVRLKEMERLLCLESTNEVRFIGIWGVGGVGKTTIANCLYDKHLGGFRAHCFMNVTHLHPWNYNPVGYLLQTIDSGLHYKLMHGHWYRNSMGDEDLRMRRLRYLNVLVVLDNVEDYRQVRDFVSKDLYGPGSRVIITTRDREVLDRCGVEESNVYKVQCLSEEESLQLFYGRAFQGNEPGVWLKEQSHEVVKSTCGLPLTLKILGDSLRKRSPGEWKDTVGRLKKVDNNDVIKLLKVSYDSLSPDHQFIFLLVVFLVDRVRFDYEMRFGLKEIVDACGYDKNGIEDLQKKSLFKLSSDGDIRNIEMHDSLREMGRMLLDQQEKSQFLSINRSNEGNQAAEGVFLEEPCNWEVFTRMKNLKFLLSRTLSFFNLNVEGFAPTNIKLLHWEGYPLKFLSEKFSLKSLVHLYLTRSRVEKLWEDTQPLPNLKTLCLAHSSSLKIIPDLSTAEKLEYLDVTHCDSLESLPFLSSQVLKSLMLSYCKALGSSLPNSFLRFSQLECLNLSHLPISKVPIVPHSLKTLDLSGTSHPSPWISSNNFAGSIKNSTSLQELDLTGCLLHEDLLESIMDLVFLMSIKVTGPQITKFPDFPRSITQVSMNDTAITEVPPRIMELSQLTKLDLRRNAYLKDVSMSVFTLPSLVELDLADCSNLVTFSQHICEKIEENASSLRTLDMRGCSSLHLRDFPSWIFELTSLQRLLLAAKERKPRNYEPKPQFDRYHSGIYKKYSGRNSYFIIEDTEIDKIPSRIKKFSGLQFLHLSGNKKLKSIPIEVFKLDSLQELYLSDCPNLESLPPEIPKTCNLKVLDLRRTLIKALPTNLWSSTSLVCLFALSPGIEPVPSWGMSNIKELELGRHDYVANGVSLEISSLYFSSALESLKLVNLNITELPDDIGKLERMSVLDLGGNDFEHVPTSIKYLSKLKELHLNSCRRLLSLPELPQSILRVDIRNCHKLDPRYILRQLKTTPKVRGRSSYVPFIMASGKVPKYLKCISLGHTTHIPSLLGVTNWKSIDSMIVCLQTSSKSRQFGWRVMEAKLFGRHLRLDLGDLGWDSDNLVFFSIPLKGFYMGSRRMIDYAFKEPIEFKFRNGGGSVVQCGIGLIRKGEIMMRPQSLLTRLLITKEKQRVIRIHYQSFLQLCKERKIQKRVEA